ncbi:hypothetical protein PRIPAC_80400 [Pristionchus pacificus]|uniref:BTB domain-containing protein n=1 Tax=Pristionchus pacificus TaxID=54126 RepID=A0A2A6BWX7_PRIPA|nr:hypothetical protein PRIPAC_80400 [Pristionchus pacificus]|eukprot:PDM70405.1 BTB domain-containing protein [Pristionchus pacificus]
MDDSMESHEMSPAPNSPASPLLDEDRSQRSVAFSPEAPIVREVTPRKTQSQPTLSDDLKKWWENPPSEVWVVLGIAVILLLIAIIVIIVKSANYNTLLQDSKNGQLSVTKECSARTHYVDFLAASMLEGIYALIRFEDLLDEGKDFFDGNRLTVECRIIVDKVTGIRSVLDFLTHVDGMNNIALNIGNCKLYASKDILAAHSPEFASMLFDKSEDTKLEELELHDVEYRDFVLLLNGFIAGDSLTIECRVNEVKVVGIRKKVEFNYFVPLEGKNNVAPKIGNIKFNVSRDILGAHSHVLEKMFFGKYQEETENEIDLMDVDAEALKNLLDMMYPTTFELTNSTVVPILHLADRFSAEATHEYNFFTVYTANPEMSTVSKLVPDFTIRCEFDKISELTETERPSETVISHDLPWKCIIMKETSARTGNQAHLNIFLECNWESEAKDWRVDYEADFAVLCKGEEKRCKTINYHSFSCIQSNKGFFKYKLFSELINPANGLIDGDTLTVECRVKVNKVSGIRKKIEFDFSKPMPGLNNTVLKIGDRTINVSKDLLALHSPVFAFLFFGKFEEENKKVIELQELVFEEFMDLLNMIYPSSFELTASNLHHIVNLADRFQVEVYVLDRIINYLHTTKKFTTAEKLKIADHYRLQRLSNLIILSFKDVAEVKTIKNTPEYKFFSDALKGAICDRILEF